MRARRRPNVLVLEDEWIIAEQIEAGLKAEGFRVVGPVGRVDAALALLDDHRVDAAVLDINVHGDRSFDLALRLVRDATPFIFLSGYAPADLPTTLSTRPLMQKPIDPPALCRCLEALLRPPR